MNVKRMRPSLSNNYWTGGRKEESICFRPGLQSPIHFACAADVSKLIVYCFLLHLYIASFLLHFHPQSEVSATPVVFFCLGIREACHICAWWSDLVFDLNYSHLCFCFISLFWAIILAVWKRKRNVSLICCTKRCFSKEIKVR